MENENLKINIMCHGDPSVGISGGDTTIDLQVCNDIFEEDKGFREDVRKRFKSIFDEIWDDNCTVLFSDEPCPWEPKDEQS